jgi:predicted small secreted protein
MTKQITSETLRYFKEIDGRYLEVTRKSTGQNKYKTRAYQGNIT